MQRKKVLVEQQPKGEIVSIVFTDAAGRITRRLISEDAPKYGGTQPARHALARKLGVSPSTLRNAAGGRLKRICADLFARLKAEEIARLNKSIMAASHELEMARAIGLDPRSAEFEALEAAVEAARKVRGRA